MKIKIISKLTVVLVLVSLLGCTALTYAESGKPQLMLGKRTFQYRPTYVEFGEYYSPMDKETFAREQIFPNLYWINLDENVPDYMDYYLEKESTSIDIDSTNAGNRKVTVYDKFSNKYIFPIVIKPFNINKLKLDFYDEEMGDWMPEYTYNGKRKKPKIEDGWFTLNGYVLDDEDYIAKYKYVNNKKVGYGKAYVTITGKGSFIGKASGVLDFEIIPKRTKIKSVKSSKRSITVKWKKAKNITGYYVYIYKASSERLIDKYKIKSRKKTSKKITGLKRHTEYEVAVSTYKKVKKHIHESEKRFKFVRVH